MLTHPFTVFILGAILVIVGLTFRYIVGRNRFNRRGIAGQQQYSSYARGLLSTGFESLLNLLGNLMLIAGLLLMLLYWYNHSNAKKHRERQNTEKKATP